MHTHFTLTPTQPQSHVLKPRVTEGSEEEVLQQLALSEQRLVFLTEELASRDLDSLRRQMEDEDVSFSACNNQTN